MDKTLVITGKVPDGMTLSASYRLERNTCFDKVVVMGCDHNLQEVVRDYFPDSKLTFYPLFDIGYIEKNDLPVLIYTGPKMEDIKDILISVSGSSIDFNIHCCQID
ncbi:MAG: hypothetical protein IBX57_01050 [Gammaproteobacteria bacterium]|nr:hypothetical protein [Gammaproteobacteria bacterium]